MTNERILIVEDERIVAEGLQTLLKKMGYTVVGIAASAEQAVQKAEEFEPDLVLMDINLKGERDGIDAAEEIVARFDLPVTFLTAYADETTLERAKTTLPFGYILKPYEENSLRSAIEVAIYKHQTDNFMRHIEQWSRDALRSLGGAVLGLNDRGALTYLNPAAEALLGVKMETQFGKPIADTVVFNPTIDALLQDALQKGKTGQFGAEQNININGHPVKVTGSVAPIQGEASTPPGAIILLQSL